MTPEEATKITEWLELRCAPRPKQEQKVALAKDLLPYQYQKVVDICRAYVTNSNWWPVISQLAPAPEPRRHTNSFKPGIKGKEAVNLIKKAMQENEQTL